MLVSLLAMFVSRFSVILRLFVLAKIMMKGSLAMMMMRGRMVMSGSLMMMLTGRMLPDFAMARAIPPNRSWKTDARLATSLLTALCVPTESVTTPFLARSFWRLHRRQFLPLCWPIWNPNHSPHPRSAAAGYLSGARYWTVIRSSPCARAQSLRRDKAVIWGGRLYRRRKTPC